MNKAKFQKEKRTAKAIERKAKAIEREAKAIEREAKANEREAKANEREARAIAGLPADLVRLRAGAALKKLKSPPPIEKVELQSTIGAYEAYRVMADGMVFFAPDLSEGKSDDNGGQDKFLRRLLDKRSWPVETVEALLPLTRGRVMLDVGANIGLTSVPRAFLRLFEHIHAFEPEPRNFACLQQSVSENHLEADMTAWHAAVGNTDGEINFATTSGIARHHVQYPCDNPDESITVPVVSLDRWILDAGVKPEDVGFVKIDTQGFEPHVLLGAQRLLSVPDVTWQFEVHLPLIIAAGVTVDEFQAMVEKWFKAFINLRDSPPSLRPVAEIGETLSQLSSDEKYTDIVGIPKGG